MSKFKTVSDLQVSSPTNQPIEAARDTIYSETVKEGSRVMRFREKQRLTLPVFSLAHTPIMVIKILSEPHEADFIIEVAGKKDSKPTVIECLNLDTDERGLLIVNAIMASAFLKAQPPLTGRYFKLTSRNIREGKKYRDIDVVELEPESE